MSPRYLAALAVAIAAFRPAPVQAITIAFEGTIDIWDSSFLGTGAAVGDTFSGLFQIDPTTTGPIGSIPSPTLRVWGLPPFTLDVLWGGVHDTITGDRVFVFNDTINAAPPGGLIDATTFAGFSSLLPSNPPPPPFVSYSAGFAFADDGSDENGDPTDDTHDLLATTDFLMPTDLDGRIGRLTLSRTTSTPTGSRVDVFAQGTLRHYAPVPVPEPGSLTLFGIGLLGLLAGARRKSV